MTTTKRPSHDGDRLGWLGWGAVTLMVLLIVTPMAWHWRDAGDFPHHSLIATRLVEEPAVVLAEVPHFLYHVLVGTLYAIFPNVWVFAWGAFVMVMSALATAVVLYGLLRRAIEAPTPLLTMGLVGLVGAFLVVAPINFLTPDNLYFGYFSANVYHNPTINLMKPFALVLFWLSLRLYDAHWRPRPRLLWGAVYLLVTLLGLLAKPSFIIILLPALGLLTAYRLLKRQHIHWDLLMGAVVLPAGALIAYQMFIMSTPEVGSGVRFEPMRVFLEWTLHYQPNANVGLIEKLLLSIAFPLVVYGLYWRATLRDMAFNLAWLAFAVSLAYSYLLVEELEVAAGNFVWSAQAGVFILFSVGLVTLVRCYGREGINGWYEKVRLGLSMGVLGLHVVAGIHWYYLHITEDFIELLYRWW